MTTERLISRYCVCEEGIMSAVFKSFGNHELSGTFGAKRPKTHKALTYKVTGCDGNTPHT